MGGQYLAKYIWPIHFFERFSYYFSFVCFRFARGQLSPLPLCYVRPCLFHFVSCHFAKRFHSCDHLNSFLFPEQTPLVFQVSKSGKQLMKTFSVTSDCCVLILAALFFPFVNPNRAANLVSLTIQEMLHTTYILSFIWPVVFWH